MHPLHPSRSYSRRATIVGSRDNVPCTRPRRSSNVIEFQIHRNVFNTFGRKNDSRGREMIAEKKEKRKKRRKNQDRIGRIIATVDTLRFFNRCVTRCHYFVSFVARFRKSGAFGENSVEIRANIGKFGERNLEGREFVEIRNYRFADYLDPIRKM